MEEKKELFDEVATEEEINEADGQPTQTKAKAKTKARRNNHGKEEDMY